MLARRDGEVGGVGVGGAWKLEAKSKRLPASSEASAAAAPAGSRGRAEPPRRLRCPRRRRRTPLRPLPRPLLPLPTAKLRLVTLVPDSPLKCRRWQGWAPPRGEGIPVRAPRPHSGKNFDAIH